MAKWAHLAVSSLRLGDGGGNGGGGVGDVAPIDGGTDSVHTRMHGHILKARGALLHSCGVYACAAWAVHCYLHAVSLLSDCAVLTRCEVAPKRALFSATLSLDALTAASECSGEHWQISVSCPATLRRGHESVCAFLF